MTNLGDIGAIKYGDRVWLQCSRYEVLGTSAVPQDVSAAWNALIHNVAEASRVSPDGGHKQYAGPDWEAFSLYYTRERETARLAAESLAQGPLAQPVGGRVRETVGRLVPVPCAGANIIGARASGRWVILHRRKPHTTIGANVVHEDDIVS